MRTWQRVQPVTPRAGARIVGGWNRDEGERGTIGQPSHPVPGPSSGRNIGQIDRLAIGKGAELVLIQGRGTCWFLKGLGRWQVRRERDMRQRKSG